MFHFISAFLVASLLFSVFVTFLFLLFSSHRIQAEGLSLPSAEAGLANPYIKLTVKSNRGATKIQRTKVQKNSDSPKWVDQIFVFESPVFPAKCQVLSKTPKEREYVIFLFSHLSSFTHRKSSLQSLHVLALTRKMTYRETNVLEMKQKSEF